MPATISTKHAIAAIVAAYLGGLTGPLSFLIVVALAAAALAGWQVAVMMQERQPHATAPVPPPLPQVATQVAAPAAAAPNLSSIDVLSALGLEVANVQFKQPAKSRAAKSNK